MAKKLIKPSEDPPTPSSLDDDEVDTSSGEDEEQISDDSSSEEDEPKDPAKTPSTETLNTPSASPGKTAVSAAKQGSDSHSDSESEPSLNLGEGKAIAVSDAKPKKKDGSDSPAVKSGKKRTKEGTSTDMHAKRAKKVSGDDDKKTGEDNKKPNQRLWSEEDEISLLQGMIDFQADTGKSPYDDMNRFYEVAKKSLSFGASKIQFGDKIRKLKRKYMGKLKKKGVESSHDKNCLGLAKHIWGSDGMALEYSAVKSPVKSKKIEKKKLDSKVEEEDKQVLGSDGMAHEPAVKSIGKSKKKKMLDSKVEEEEKDQQVLIPGGDSESTNWFEKSFLVRSIVSLGVEESSVKKKWSKVPMETKKRIEEKFKLVEAKQYELLLQKTDILKDVASVFSETS